MIRICLVGEIGSGKTFISKHFGYPVFNADKEVKKIYKNNKKCFLKLSKKFPKHIKSFPILKTEIKQILNKKNIKFISKIVHPFVRESLKKFLKRYNKKKCVVMDIPLLIENKLYKKNDIIIYVKASKKNISNRLKKRDNFDLKTMNILKSQQEDKLEKIKLSNFIINNNIDKKGLLKQINNIKKKINA